MEQWIFALPIVIFFIVFWTIFFTVIKNVKKAMKENLGNFDFSKLKELQKKAQNNQLNMNSQAVELSDQQIEMMITKELERLKIKEFEPEKKKPEWMNALGKISAVFIFLAIIIVFGMILRGIDAVSELPKFLQIIEQSLRPYTNFILNIDPESIGPLIPFILLILIPKIVVNVASKQKKNAIAAYKEKGHTLFLTNEEMTAAIEFMKLRNINTEQAKQQYSKKLVELMLLMGFFKSFGKELQRNITEMM